MRMTITKFPQSIHNKLKMYVYLYIDPRNDQVFYVGKGKGDRVFSHLSDTTEREKTRRIAEIRKAGLEPKLELVVHGIEDDETIKRIEASIIDTFGLDSLTNIQRGYHSKEYGRMSIEQLLAIYAPKRVVVTDPVLAFKINKTFHYGMTERELYDYTRHSWELGERRSKAKYALTVYHGVVQEVYVIKKWLPQNSTPNLKSERGELEDASINSDRWEFVGEVAPQRIREKYLYRDVSGYLKSKQSSFAYINC